MHVRYLRAYTSAASMLGLFVRAFRLVRRILASLKPAARNSFRKAPPSFAPAIQRNQFSMLHAVSTGSTSRSINSAA